MQRLLLFLCMLCCFSALGQVAPILSSEDTTAMHDALTPQSMQVNPEDDQAMHDTLKKAAYALKRLKNVIEMKKDILWRGTISSAIKDFQDTTYILISPLMKVEGNGVLIGLVSKVGEINLFDPIDPYVNLYWIMKPATTELQEPFTLELEIDHGDMLPEELFESILLDVESHYSGKVYQKVSDSQEDITNATIEFLNLLKDKVGDDYAPKYLFKVGSKEYRGGSSLTMFERLANQEDTVVSIYLIDRITKQIVQSGITWDGADVDAYHAYVDKDSIGTHEITASIEDTLEYSFTLHLIGDDILSVITQSATSVFEEALVEAMQLLVDSAQAKEDEYQEQKALSEEMRAQMIAKIENVCGTATSAAATVLYSSDSTAFVQEPIPNAIKTHGFLGQYINRANAEHLARVAFIFAWTNRQVLLEFTKDASKRAAFRDAVMDDIGTLAADITMALITGDSEETKEFLVGFIVEKVNATTTAQLKSK